MAQFLNSDVVIKSDGVEVEGIQQMTLDINIDAIASRFSLSFSARPPLGDHAPLEIFLHDQLRLTGFAEADVGGEDKDKDSFTVSGRSKTADLIAGCVVHDSGEWLNQDLAGIARDIVAPFESRLSVRGGVGAPFSTFKVSTSEKAQAALRRLADNRGLVIRDTPRGDVLISSPVWSEATSGLIRRLKKDAFDHNVLRSNVKRDNSKRHDVVIVRGQSEGWDLGSIQIEGRAYDKNIKRYRPLILSANKGVTKSDAQNLAEWEVARRLGEALTWRGKVRGWRQGETGNLWDVGYLVPVLDEKYGVDARLLVTSVSFLLSPGEGAVTELTLQPPDAFLPKPMITETGPSTQPWARVAAEVQAANVKQ